MNGGAYGGDFAGVLERALVATADGSGWLTPAELGLSYRHSELRHGQVVLRAELRLRPRPPDEIKAEVRELNTRRKAAQPTNRRTFGSVFKNPEHELSAGRMLEACGLKGHRSRRRPDLAEARELHRERRRRHDGGRARAHGRSAAPCARAVRRHAPSTRSSFSASSSCPHCRRVRPGAENRKMPARASLPSVHRACGSHPRRGGTSRGRKSHPRAWLARVAPTRRSLAVGFGVLAFALGGYLLARETSLFAIDRIEVQGRLRAGRRPGPRRRSRPRGTAPRRPRRLGRACAGSTRFRRSSARATTGPSRTRCASPSCPERPAAVLRRGPDSWLVSTRGRVMEPLSSQRRPEAAADLGLDADLRSGPGPRSRRAGAATAAHAAGLAGAFAPRVASASYTTGRSCSIFARASSSCSAMAATSSSSSRSPSACSRAAGRLDLPRREHPRADRCRGSDRRPPSHQQPLVEVEAAEPPPPVDTERLAHVRSAALLLKSAPILY